MRSLIAITLFIFTSSAFAASFTLKAGPQARAQFKTVSANGMQFTKVQYGDFQNNKVVGEPALPVKSWLLTADSAKDIQVSIKYGTSKKYSETLPYPTQQEECRCPSDRQRQFEMNKKAYELSTPEYRISTIGAFRGQWIHRLDVFMGHYKAGKRQLELFESVEVQTNADKFEFQSTELKNYLILGPEQYMSGVSGFAEWRRSQGYNVSIEPLLAPELTLERVGGLIKDYYDRNAVDFLIIVGAASEVPMHSVQTSDGKTPSDLPYITFDGEADYIPDVFASRLVVNDAQDAAQRLAKASEFEMKSVKNPDGLKRVIGISSSEGYNPSDEEYIESVNTKYREVLGMDSLHLNENDSDSIPSVLNNNLDGGALWLNYMGHGSGRSWPSMRKSYRTSHIAELQNRESVKPIVIDVACLNGRVEKGYLGSTFSGLDIMGNAFGGSAYYGGTVNISWHPPAIMSRGIAYEHTAKNFKHIGQALLAGQLFLAENYSSTDDVVDNMEWYHLQGDPGMAIGF